MLGIFLDIETSGLDPFNHKILEIAIKLINLKNGSLEGEYESIALQTKETWKKRDLNSIAVNGFTWELIQTGKALNEIHSEIISLFLKANINRDNSVFICQNPSFDRMFFVQLISTYEQEKKNWPYHWLDLASMHWAFAVKNHEPKKNNYLQSIPLSKNAIAKKLNLTEESSPHKAINGVDHLILCYKNLVGFPFN